MQKELIQLEEEDRKKIEFEFNFEEDKEDLSTQEQTINSLVINCYNLLSQSTYTNPTQISQMFYLVRTLALRLGEKQITGRLDELFSKVPVTPRYVVPLMELEYIYTRDWRFGYSPSKSYSNKKIELRHIIFALARVKRELLNIFTHLAIKWNIDLSSITPPSLGRDEEMPDLG